MGDSQTPRQSIPSNKRGRPPKNEKVNPWSEKYFETEDKKSGDNPPRPLDNYDEALKEFKSEKLIFDSKLFALQMDVSQNPLYYKLTEQLRLGRHSPIKEDIKNCDDAFACYLKYCSERVNADFFRIIWKYIILYREAFNQYGPDKYVSEDSTQQWEKEYYSALHKKFYEKSFSELVGTEFLPDIANELYIFFQSYYLKLGITKDQVKEITLNFTSWLNKNGLTTAKVTL